MSPDFISKLNEAYNTMSVIEMPYEEAFKLMDLTEVNSEEPVEDAKSNLINLI